MADLFRVTNLKDGQHTWMFTFTIPRSATQKDHQPTDILSREFVYGGLRWRIMLTKRDKVHLSPYLELCERSKGLVCTLDMMFQLVNVDSFTQNEVFKSTRSQFTCENPRQGNRTFVSMEEIQRRTGFRGQTLLFELTLRAPEIVWTSSIELNSAGLDGPPDCQRYDTDVFTYGSNEWRLMFCPNMDVDPSDHKGRHLVQLQRMNRTESLHQLRYRMLLGAQPTQRSAADQRLSVTGQGLPPIREDLFDFNGATNGFYVGDSVLVCVNGVAILPIKVVLLSVAPVSHVKVQLNTLQAAGQVSVTPRKPVHTSLRDSERQQWQLYANTNGQLQLTMVYHDLKNIPDGYARYVCWGMRLMPDLPGNARPLDMTPEPLDCYFYQSTKDPATSIATSVTNDQILGDDSLWTDKYDGNMTVEVTWLASHLFSCPGYTVNDDILRRQTMQMRRELESLQYENSALERDVHKYQLSLAERFAAEDYANSNGVPRSLTPPGTGKRVPPRSQTWHETQQQKPILVRQLSSNPNKTVTNVNQNNYNNYPNHSARPNSSSASSGGGGFTMGLKNLNTNYSEGSRNRDQGLAGSSNRDQVLESPPDWLPSPLSRMFTAIRSSSNNSSPVRRSQSYHATAAFGRPGTAFDHR